MCACVSEGLYRWVNQCYIYHRSYIIIIYLNVSVCLSVCLFVYPSVCLSVCLCAFLPWCVCYAYAISVPSLSDDLPLISVASNTALLIITHPSSPTLLLPEVGIFAEGGWGLSRAPGGFPAAISRILPSSFAFIFLLLLSHTKGSFLTSLE